MKKIELNKRQREYFKSWRYAHETDHWKFRTLANARFTDSEKLRLALGKGEREEVELLTQVYRLVFGGQPWGVTCNAENPAGKYYSSSKSWVETHQKFCAKALELVGLEDCVSEAALGRSEYPGGVYEYYGFTVDTRRHSDRDHVGCVKAMLKELSSGVMK